MCSSRRRTGFPHFLEPKIPSWVYCRCIQIQWVISQWMAVLGSGQPRVAATSLDLRPHGLWTLRNVKRVEFINYKAGWTKPAHLQPRTPQDLPNRQVRPIPRVGLLHRWRSENDLYSSFGTAPGEVFSGSGPFFLNRLARLKGAIGPQAMRYLKLRWEPCATNRFEARPDIGSFASSHGSKGMWGWL